MTAFVGLRTRYLVVLGVAATGIVSLSGSVQADVRWDIIRPVGYQYDACPPCAPYDTYDSYDAYTTDQSPADPTGIRDSATDSGAGQPSRADSPMLDSSDFSQNATPRTVSSAGGSGSLSPGMIGDAFGGGGFQTIDPFYSFIDSIPLISPGRLVGLQKLADNGSPIPLDRVFFNYDYFDNVVFGSLNANVNRMTFGFEKTFLNQNASFEFRVPFASTLSSSLFEDTASLPVSFFETTDTQLGDITMNFKALLYRTCYTSWGAGIGLSVPTAEDITINDAEGPPTNVEVVIENEAIRLYPYFGFQTRSPSGMFASGIFQVETTVADSPVVDYDNGAGPSGEDGSIRDASVMFCDLQIGRWCYRNPCSSCVTGVAPIFEYHWNQLLGDSDIQSFDPDFPISGISGSDSVGVHNLLFGSIFEMGPRRRMQVGYAFPISGAQEFDYEVRLSFNWLFGGGRR